MFSEIYKDQIEYCDFYTKEIIQGNPDKIFVFGDNLAREGKGGQSLACRGEPNIIGIPTKYSPYIFFSDDMYIEWIKNSVQDFTKLKNWLERGETIVFPSGGLGTGLADLKNKAPFIWNQLHVMLNFICKQRIYDV